MLHTFKFIKIRICAFISFLAYVVSIAFGAVQYLPYQTYAPGVFKTYSVGEFDFFIIFAVALLAAFIVPMRVEKPSDWFLLIFVIFLILPGVTLGVISDALSIEKKIELLPLLVIFIMMIFVAGEIDLIKYKGCVELPIGKNILYVGLIGWLVFSVLLITKYHAVMRISELDNIYEQRELTSAVGAIWGYIQLYYTYVFSTILIAYGLSSNAWRWILIGSGGYFLMYLITAEKSVLLFPLFFVGVGFISKTKKPALEIITIAVGFFAAIIFAVVFFWEKFDFLNKIGFYFFARLIATPSQFILDYYDFFSTNGFTYFSQIKGYNLIVDPPSQYATNVKWPQLGWIVGSGAHGIESNSNATFIASDGAASLGAWGMIIVTFYLCLYLMTLNSLVGNFNKTFWSAIFAQQALSLISGSLFSLLLSFGGLFYLILFLIYRTSRPDGLSE
jgi:hypothetical protein